MKKRKWINYLMIGAVISILLGVGVEKYQDNQIKSYTTENITSLYQPKTEEPDKPTRGKTAKKEYPKEEIPKEYKGYNVTAKLEIPKINLETYILSTYSKNSLNLSVTKFWGADSNQKGNFCVAGHNFQNKNMFHNLRKLEKKDRLWITDHEVGKVEYEIYNIYTVEPEDVTCLLQETGRKKRSNPYHLYKRFPKKNYCKSKGDRSLKKKYLFIGILFLLMSVSLFIYFHVTASTKLEGIESFPVSYQPYLKELAKKHPNWKFTAMYTNLDWTYVINQENVFGKNLVPKNYGDSWKNTTPGQYNVEVDSRMG